MVILALINALGMTVWLGSSLFAPCNVGHLVVTSPLGNWCLILSSLSFWIVGVCCFILLPPVPLWLRLVPFAPGLVSIPLSLFLLLIALISLDEDSFSTETQKLQFGTQQIVNRYYWCRGGPSGYSIELRRVILPDVYWSRQIESFPYATCFVTASAKDCVKVSVAHGPITDKGAYAKQYTKTINIENMGW